MSKGVKKGKSLGTIETLSMEKYQKDLEKIKEKKNAARSAMRKKLEKKVYKFQKDPKKVEKKFNKKKKEGELTDKDILLAFICLELTPMVHGATIQIRGASEMALINNKEKPVKDIVQYLPKSFPMTNGFMALIEPEIDKLARRLKKHYKQVYSK